MSRQIAGSDAGAFQLGGAIETAYSFGIESILRGVGSPIGEARD